MSEPTQRELEVQNAKAALLASGTYDIMVKVIRKILDERPANASDQLGLIFDKVKLESCAGEDNLSALQTASEKSQETEIAEIQKNLYEQTQVGENDVNEDDDENSLTILPDMQELLYFFEQGGVGLGREEWIRVYFGLKQLCDGTSGTYPPLVTCRFWGKILGLEKNYYVAEVAFREEDEEEEPIQVEESESVINEDDDAEDVEGEKLPQSAFRTAPKVPYEEKASAGANKFTYYVVNEPGEEWIRLPPVCPSHIVTARSITKFFTGRLEATVSSFPEFPGDERHLLRAQIARISAGTIIAPMMYYQFDDEEEVDDEDMAQTEFIENPDFEGVPIRDLADESLQAWVHTRLHLLQQGRCIWWNPKQKPDGDDEDYDEDDEDIDPDEGGEQEQEIGPPLLTPLSEDVEIAGVRAWSAHTSSAPGMMHIQHCICVIKSNLWPGAAAFSNGRRFENLYVGYGNKYSTDNYSPQMCQGFERENKEPEMHEVADPTVEEENALDAQKAAEQEEADAEDEEDED